MIEAVSCCVIENHSIVSREENGKTFQIDNKERRNIQVCVVDNCLIKGADRRCDYLFFLYSDDPQKIILVEFKGVDHLHALSQLIETSEKLNLKSQGVPQDSYIIGAPSPKANTQFQKALLKLAPRLKKAGLNPPQRKNHKHIVRLD